MAGTGGVPPEHEAGVQAVGAGQGEYDLTFAQAQHSLAERAGLLPDHTVEVIVVRDPDRSNDYTVVIDGTIRPDATTDHVRVLTTTSTWAPTTSPPPGSPHNWNPRVGCRRWQPRTPAR